MENVKIKDMTEQQLEDIKASFNLSHEEYHKKTFSHCYSYRCYWEEVSSKKEFIEVALERATELTVEFEETEGEIEGICLKEGILNPELMEIPAPWRLSALGIEPGLYGIYDSDYCLIQEGQGKTLCKALRYLSSIKEGAVIVIDKKKEDVFLRIEENFRIEGGLK